MILYTIKLAQKPAKPNKFQTTSIPTLLLEIVCASFCITSNPETDSPASAATPATPSQGFWRHDPDVPPPPDPPLPSHLELGVRRDGYLPGSGSGADAGRQVTAREWLHLPLGLALLYKTLQGVLKIPQEMSDARDSR